MTIDMLTIEEIARLEKINDTDHSKVESIMNSIIEGSFSSPDILYSELHRIAITGSHRIEACRRLVELDEESNFSLGYREIELDAMDVDEYISEFCENTGNTVDQLPYDNLREIFEGTDMEEFAKENEEW